MIIVIYLLYKASVDPGAVPVNDLMDILNQTEPIVEIGPDMQNDVANSIKRLFTNKMTKTSVDKFKEIYKLPGNCKLMGVPKVNQEIWPLLPPRIRQSDFSLQQQHQTISMTSVIIAKMAERLFVAEK